MDFERLAEIILQGIGGSGNIAGFTHCATRLRFTLRDESLTDEALLKSTKGILGIARNGGQFQVIIGNDVNKAYAALQKKTEGSTAGAAAAKTDAQPRRSPSEVIFDFVSSVFTPVLPAIIGAGLIKSLLAIALLLGMDAEGNTYYFLNLIGDAPLYYLPIMLAFTAAKKLNCNAFLAAAIAGAMLHPGYAALITDAYNLHFSSFLGIPVALATYSASVLPVLFMVPALKGIEALLERYLPKTIKFFFKPLLCLLIAAPLTFIVLGPIGFVIGIAISNGLNLLNEVAGWIVPTLIGTFFPLMVAAGMHYGLVPFMMQSVAANGFETIAGPGNLLNACISMLISFLATFALVFFWGFEEKTASENPEVIDAVPEAEILISSPAKGRILPLSEVPDATFSQEILGKGTAVEPTENEIYSPISGIVETAFPTGHAVGLKGENGEEILIHVGLDTVQLEGKHFHLKVQEGQKVKRGDLLLVCELDKVRAAGYSVITPVIVTNSEDFEQVVPVSAGTAKPGSPLLTLQKGL